MTTVESRKYLDPKTLDKITRMDLRARLVVEGFMTGMHKSPYHGYAVEFATHREYTPGDEIKHIDWKVWARADRLYIKEYEEETNLKCTILLDCSRSMAYGTKPAHRKEGMSKFDYAATTAACLAYLIQRQQDAVGLVTFDNEVRINLPPSSRPRHLKQVLHELEHTRTDHRSDVSDVFHRLTEQIRRREMVVLISDLFVDVPTLIKSLQHFRHHRHEVVVFHVLHDHELTFPFEDNTLFRGLETDDEVLTQPRVLRSSYLELLNQFIAQVRKSCADNGIDYLRLSTKDPLDAALASYLVSRQRVKQRVHRQ